MCWQFLACLVRRYPAVATVIKSFAPCNLSFYSLIYVKILNKYSCSLFVSSNNTLWGSLEEPNIINTNEFEDLFSKATLQAKKKPLSDTYEKKAKAKKVDLFAWITLQLGLSGIFLLSNFFHGSECCLKV